MSTEIDQLYSRLKVLDTPLDIQRTKKEQVEVREILDRLRILFCHYPYLFNGTESD